MAPKKEREGVSSKPLFIVFEGIDGSGTTTQAKLLSLWMEKNKIPHILDAEPSSGYIGNLLREYLKKKTHPKVDALLFAADRAEHTVKIQNHLQNEKHVVLDRYVESSLAYQSAQGIEEDWLERINEFHLSPDITVLLDLDVDLALKRKARDPIANTNEKFENAQFLQKVRELYLKRAQVKNFDVLDATLPKEEIHQLVINIVQSKS
ncbi:MAG: dTMP kinase [Candidatus Ranarchaeia archaeon]|jgi:dTMP kinase